MTKQNIDKWSWMTAYRLKYRIPPAQKWAWNKARNAYNNQHGISND